MKKNKIKIINTDNEKKSIRKILTAQAVVFTRFSETMGTARGVALLVGVGSDHVATRSVVAHVELGVSTLGVIVIRVSATHVRSLAPNQLKQTMKQPLELII